MKRLCGKRSCGAHARGRRSKHRQNGELECEGGRERDWREEPPLDSDGPMVETPAPNRSSVDREDQFELVQG